MPITFTQATLGADLKIPMVDGTEESYRIPEGTQNGTRFAGAVQAREQLEP